MHTTMESPASVEYRLHGYACGSGYRGCSRRRRHGTLVGFIANRIQEKWTGREPEKQDARRMVSRDGRSDTTIMLTPVTNLQYETSSAPQQHGYQLGRPSDRLPSQVPHNESEEVIIASRLCSRVVPLTRTTRREEGGGGAGRDVAKQSKVEEESPPEILRSQLQERT